MVQKFKIGHEEGWVRQMPVFIGYGCLLEERHQKLLAIPRITGLFFGYN
jgi:hypothetical protein